MLSPYFIASQVFIMSAFFIASFSMSALCMQSVFEVFMASFDIALLCIVSFFIVSFFIVSDFMASSAEATPASERPRMKVQAARLEKSLVMEFSWNEIAVSAGGLPMAHTYPFEKRRNALQLHVHVIEL
ncbi:hypothetical protein RHECNPAF_14110051 [Rhizobium etli CNPAF512]|nr:hypothetical protein RHECNPAF_14110051 [Rhizobium etli CNPAF512]